MSPAFHLVQISDLHLPAMPETHYRGLDPWASLEQVLLDICQLEPLPDLMLVSGDNVHHGAVADYRHLADRLDATGIPWRWIPGNHDCAAAMATAKPETLPPVTIPGWRLLLLDSTHQPDGRGGGALSPASLNALAEVIDAPEPLLILMHHNPLPVGGWQDAIGLANADRFWSWVDQRVGVTLVLCGHLHRVVEQQRGCTKVLSCPSTVVQFAPGNNTLVLESLNGCGAPGYRRLRLSESILIDTSVVRVGNP